MDLASLALVARILLLGVERIIVKRLGTGAEPAAGAFLLFAVGTLVLVPPALVEVSRPGFAWLGPLAAASAVYAAAFVLYVRSLALGDASLVSPLYSANVVFLAVAAHLVLGEPLGAGKVLGIGLLVLGAARLSPRGSLLRSLAALGSDEACRSMVGASLLIAVGRVIDTATLAAAPPERYAALLYAAISLWLALWLTVRGKLSSPLTLALRRPGLALACGAVNGLSYLCLLRALARFDVGVAEPASMLGLLVTMGLARLLLGEPVRERLPGALLMLGGAWLVLLPP